MPTLTPITAILDADIAAFRTAMADANVITDKTMAGISSSTATANAAYREFTASTVALADAQKVLADAQASGTATADEIAAAQDKVTVAEDRLASSSERAALAQQKLMVAERDAAAAAKETAIATTESSTAMEDFAIAGAGGMAKLGAAATLGLGIVGYESAKSAVDFQGSMERIHTQAQVPQAAIAGLSQQVEGLAGQVGFSPNNLSDALYHVESTFASMPANLIASGGAMNVTKIAAEGAAVGHADLVSTATALGATLAAGLPGINNAAQAMGLLNATVGAGDMKMQDLNAAMGTGFMANVKAYGVNINDVGAALAVFGDNNMRGARAGTQLRMSVQAIAVPASTAGKALHDLGMTSTTMADEMAKHGMNAAITDLHTRLVNSHKPMQDWGQIVTEIFGKRAGAGIVELIMQYDRLESKYPQMTTGAKNFSDAWAATQATMQQKVAEFKSSIEALGVSFGTLLLPWIQKGLDALTRLGVYLETHQQVMKDVAIVIGVVLVAAIGAMVVAFVAATWEVMVVVVAIAALAAGAKYLWDHCTVLRDIVHSLSDDFTSILLPSLKGAWDMLMMNLAPAFKQITDTVEAHRAGLKQLIDVIITADEWMIKIATYILGVAIVAFAWFAGAVFRAVITDIGDFITIIEKLVGACQTVVGWLGSVASAASNVMGAVSGVGSMIGSFGSMLGFADGGFVPGAEGQAQLAVVHGGEFVVSNSMMKGGGGGVAMAGGSGAGSGGGGGQQSVNVQNYLYIDGTQMQTVTQRQTLQYNQRNGSNGLSLQNGR